MRKASRKLLDTAVSYLTILGFKPENIIVTGSIALDMQGLLPEGHEIHDVDLIIKMKEDSWRCLKLLEAVNLANEEKDNMYPGRKDTIFFKFKDVTLNIWRNDMEEKSDIRDAVTGVYVATAAHTIKAKKDYNREKDVRDINAIIKQILN